MNLPNTMTTDLPHQLFQIGLRATAGGLDDLLARAISQRWAHRQLLEEIARNEIADKGARNLERRSRLARIGRFKPMIDFDWNWPKHIDRPLIEQWLKLDYVREHRNLIMIGTNGVGKTMIIRNLAHLALQAGQTVMFRRAAELISDLTCDSPRQRRQKLRQYAGIDLLCIDEIGYLSYDASAADLLYEVVNARYESGSIAITTNRNFSQWNEVFPNATSIGTMLDRLAHHADITVVEGPSYRLHESEVETAARRRTR